MDVPYQECVSEIHAQTNSRIYARNIPSQPLQPYLDVRPAMTKYSHFPVVDPRVPTADVPTSLRQLPTYDCAHTFSPATTRAPFSGFQSNVNVESGLRNQVYALQPGSQAVFVPSSQSELYVYRFAPTPTGAPAHPWLCNSNPGTGDGSTHRGSEQVFAAFDPNPDRSVCGTALFYNNTRCQVKDMGACGRV